MRNMTKRCRKQFKLKKRKLTLEHLEDRRLFAVLSAGDSTSTPAFHMDMPLTFVTAAPGLVAAWGFDEASGNTVSDSSGNNLNGTISGASRTASGKFGSALSFDGINDWVTVNDNNLLDLTTGMTLEAWVNPSTLGSSAWRNVLIKKRTDGDVYNLYANGDTNAPTAYVVSSGVPTTWTNARDTEQLPLNTWSHLAATFDGAVLRMFVNGTQAGSSNLAGSLLTSDGVLRIGGNSIWGEYFAGLIDEVRIYNRALNQTEIQTDMNSAIVNADPPLGNQWTPLVYAGADFTVDISHTAAFNAEAISNATNGLSVVWSQVSGPGSASLSNSNSANATVNFSSAGVYEFQLTVTNEFASASDRVLVTVVSNNVEQVLATNSPLTLAEGATATITSTKLNTTDADNTPAQLTYTITTGPTRGTLRRSGAATTSFTQADINSNLISYQHNGSETTSDSFTFSVNDLEGSSTTGTFQFVVTPVNDEQTLTTNSPLSLQAGGTGTITSALLLTSDPDNTAAQLIYTITSGPTKGTLRRSGVTTTSFTQADINAGLVTYQNNSSQATSDSFSFSVNDGQGASTSGSFSINVTLSGGALPDLPQNFLNTTLDPTYNRPADIFVAAGGNVQTAINSAQPGDIIELQAGATFTGNFTLPNKSGNDWIYIRTSDYANLPAPGTRVGPADANHMARLRSTNKNSLLKTNSNAHNYRFIGIEFEAAYASTDVNYNIIRLEGNADNIIFDRVYIHGSTTGNTYDGISAAFIGRLGVVDSYISEIHVAQGQQESHGIFLLGATGPVKIENNYIEAAGENLLVGGNGVNTGATLTTDLTIRGNHFFKPLSWRNPIASGPNAGLKWKVKNLLELKEGTRVLIEGNVFENNWSDGQQGYAILLTPRDGPITDVTFRSNFIDLGDSPDDSGFQITPASAALEDVLLENNILYGHDWRFLNSGGSDGGAVKNFTIRHNTVVGSGTMVFLEGGTPAINGWKVYDNILHNGYGILGSGTGEGLPTVTHWTQNYDWNNNVIIGAVNYSENAQFRGFRYAANNGAVGFTSTSFNSIADFRLATNSTYKNAGTDGKDIGADVNAMLAIMSQSAGAQALQDDLIVPGSETQPVAVVDSLILASLPILDPDSGLNFEKRDIYKPELFISGEEIEEEEEDHARNTVFSTIAERDGYSSSIRKWSSYILNKENVQQELSKKVVATDRVFSSHWDSLSLF